jgi:hypothetical protein
LLRYATQTSPFTPEQLRTLRTCDWIKKWGLTTGATLTNDLSFYLSQQPASF